MLIAVFVCRLPSNLHCGYQMPMWDESMFSRWTADEERASINKVLLTYFFTASGLAARFDRIGDPPVCPEVT